MFQWLRRGGMAGPAVVLALAQSAGAAILFSESFELPAETVGNLPTRWTASIVATPLRIKVDNVKASDGSQSLYVQDRNGSGRSVTLISPIAVAGLADVVVRFDVAQFTDSYETPDYVGLDVRYDSGAYVPVLRDAAKINGGGSAASPLTYSGAQLDMTSTDQLPGSVTFLSYFVQLSGVNASELRLKFVAKSSSASEDYWIDNIEVSSIPEPASLSLLVLSGALVINWRRRAS